MFKAKEKYCFVLKMNVPIIENSCVKALNRLLWFEHKVTHLLDNRMGEIN